MKPEGQTSLRVYGPADHVAWLISQSEDALEKWIRQFLQLHDPRPLSLSIDRDHAAELLCDLWLQLDNIQTQIVFRRAVCRLVSEVAADANPGEYSMDVITLAGYVGATGAAHDLLLAAKRRAFADHNVRRKNLHNHVLQVLFGLSNSRDLLAICRRDLFRRETTLLAFRKLWEISYVEGAHAIGQLVELWPVDHLPVATALRRFYASVGPSNIRSVMAAALRRLAPTRLAKLIEASAAAGLLIEHAEPADREGLLLEWRLEAPTQSIFLPISLDSIRYFHPDVLDAERNLIRRQSSDPQKEMNTLRELLGAGTNVD